MVIIDVGLQQIETDDILPKGGGGGGKIESF